MSTWMQDIQKQNPKLYDAYKITGNQSYQHLRNMVKALSMCSMLNSDEDNKRLAAAKYILANKGETQCQ